MVDWERGERGMNWIQRTLLIVGALFLLLFAANNVLDSFSPRSNLATVQFVLAIGFLMLACRRRM